MKGLVLLIAPANSGGTVTAFEDLGFKLPVFSAAVIRQMVHNRHCIDAFPSPEGSWSSHCNAVAGGFIPPELASKNRFQNQNHHLI